MRKKRSHGEGEKKADGLDKQKQKIPKTKNKKQNQLSLNQVIRKRNGEGQKQREREQWHWERKKKQRRQVGACRSSQGRKNKDFYRKIFTLLLFEEKKAKQTINKALSEDDMTRPQLYDPITGRFIVTGECRFMVQPSFSFFQFVCFFFRWFFSYPQVFTGREFGHALSIAGHIERLYAAACHVSTPKRKKK